jgi:hypothetical protein
MNDALQRMDETNKWAAMVKLRDREIDAMLKIIERYSDRDEKMTEELKAVAVEFEKACKMARMAQENAKKGLNSAEVDIDAIQYTLNNLAEKLENLSKCIENEGYAGLKK